MVPGWDQEPGVGGQTAGSSRSLAGPIHLYNWGAGWDQMFLKSTCLLMLLKLPAPTGKQEQQ